MACKLGALIAIIAMDTFKGLKESHHKKAIKDGNISMIMINFKKVVSVVVMFSLVLCSCGGNKDKGSGGREGGGTNVITRRLVQWIYTENGEKTAARKEDVTQVGMPAKINTRYRDCVDSKEFNKLKCVHTINHSVILINSVNINGQLFRSKEDLQCILKNEGKGCKPPPPTECKLQAGSKKCESSILVEYVTEKAEMKANEIRLAKKAKDEYYKAKREKKQKKAKKAEERAVRAREHAKQREQLTDKGIEMAKNFVAECGTIKTNEEGEAILSEECQKKIIDFDDLIYNTLLGDDPEKKLQDAKNVLEDCSGFTEMTSPVGSILSYFRHNEKCAKKRETFYDLKQKNDEVENVIVAIVRKINEAAPGFRDLVVTFPDKFVDKTRKSNFLHLIEQEGSFWSLDDFEFDGQGNFWNAGDILSLKWWQERLYHLIKIGKGRANKAENKAPSIIRFFDDNLSTIIQFLASLTHLNSYLSFIPIPKLNGFLENLTGLPAILSLTISNFFTTMMSPNILLLTLAGLTTRSLNISFKRIIFNNLLGNAVTSLAAAMESALSEPEVRAIDLAKKSSERNTQYIAAFGSLELTVGVFNALKNIVKKKNIAQQSPHERLLELIEQQHQEATQQVQQLEQIKRLEKQQRLSDGSSSSTVSTVNSRTFHPFRRLSSSSSSTVSTVNSHTSSFHPFRRMSSSSSSTVNSPLSQRLKDVSYVSSDSDVSNDSDGTNINRVYDRLRKPRKRQRLKDVSYVISDSDVSSDSDGTNMINRVYDRLRKSRKRQRLKDVSSNRDNELENAKTLQTLLENQRIELEKQEKQKLSTKQRLLLKQLETDARKKQKNVSGGDVQEHSVVVDDSTPAGGGDNKLLLLLIERRKEEEKYKRQKIEEKIKERLYIRTIRRQSRLIRVGELSKEGIRTTRDTQLAAVEALKNSLEKQRLDDMDFFGWSKAVAKKKEGKICLARALIAICQGVAWLAESPIEAFKGLAWVYGTALPPWGRQIVSMWGCQILSSLLSFISLILVYFGFIKQAPPEKAMTEEAVRALIENSKTTNKAIATETITEILRKFNVTASNDGK